MPPEHYNVGRYLSNGVKVGKNETSRDLFAFLIVKMHNHIDAKTECRSKAESANSKK
jgi:hypothetical protein